MTEKTLINFYKISSPQTLTAWFYATTKNPDETVEKLKNCDNGLVVVFKFNDHKIELLKQIEYDDIKCHHEMCKQYNRQETCETYHHDNRIYKELDNYKTAYKLETSRARKDKTNEYVRKYYEANKEMICERKRRYREANKDKINEKAREVNKDKVTCECGSMLSKYSLKQHKETSKQHYWYLKKLDEKNV